MKTVFLRLAVLASIACIPSITYADAGNSNLLFYRGTFTDTDLMHIMLKQEFEYRDSSIYVIGLNKKLNGRLRNLTFEKEGLLGIHQGIMNHIEVNGLLIARYNLPIPVSLGLGEGLSLASRNPDLENKRPGMSNPYEESETSSKLLNYLMFEVEIKPPERLTNARPFLRIHHRSGIYGVYCPPTCGSNFISYGIKISY